MDASDGRRKLFIDKRFVFYTAGFFIIMALLLTLFFFINVKADEPWTNCSQIYAATGRKDILKGDKLYNPAMDRDKDGRSCE